jgi:RNA polymerase sigma-70 factor, ECF subfamily
VFFICDFGEHTPLQLLRRFAVLRYMSTMAICQPGLDMEKATLALAPNSRNLPSDAEAERATITAILGGNANAFQALVEANQTRVYNLAYRMLSNQREAEDAAQDAFTQAYARLRSYNPEWRFKTWIMSITSNLCIDRLRRRKLEPMTFADFAAPGSEADADPIEATFVSHDPGPDAIAVTTQRRETVRALLGELPAEDRAMVVMFYWDDMSYEDIAKSTGSSLSAVKSRLFRARQKMAQSAQVALL